MSLTAHLKDPGSPIRQFIRQRFAQTTNITKIANPQLRSAGTINPGFPSWVYRHLGTAIDYRIRYSFTLTPATRLAAWHAVPYLIVKGAEDDNDLPFDWDEVPKGMLIFTPVDNDGAILVEAQGPYPMQLLNAFFTSLDATVATMQPIGRRLERDEEHVLARYCFVLALLEDVGRTGSYTHNLLMEPAPRRTVDELLAIAEDAWIDDLCALSTLFYDNYHHLLSMPFIPNPTFVGSDDIGGADADIIVDGCLIEMKASIQPKINPQWLYQLVGYALLDYDDHYSIQSVGIYMARQGTLLQWPIGEFLRLLTGTESVSLFQLRQAFHTLSQSTKQVFCTQV